MSFPIQPLAYILMRCPACGHWWRRHPSAGTRCPECSGAGVEA